MIRACQLTGADATLWRTLRLEALAHYPQAFLTTYEEARDMPVEQIAARLDAGHTFGVFDANRLTGIGSLIPLTRAQTRHRGEVGGFYVRPKAQGRGYADALMQAIIEASEALGIWQLELYVAATNPSSIAFYQKHGFAEVGRLPNAVLVGDAAVTDLILVRTRR